MAAGAGGAGPVSHLGGVRSSGFRSFVREGGGGSTIVVVVVVFVHKWRSVSRGSGGSGPPTPGGRRRVQVCKSFAPPQRYSLMFL